MTMESFTESSSGLRVIADRGSFFSGKKTEMLRFNRNSPDGVCSVLAKIV